MRERIFRYRKVPKQCLNCLYHKLQREDGLKYKSRDRWHYELAQAVLKKDRKLLREVKKDVELQTEKKVTWQLKIEDWLLELVEKEAKRLGLTKADIVRLALRKYFKLT